VACRVAEEVALVGSFAEVLLDGKEKKIEKARNRGLLVAYMWTTA
jgi:hypothetical protein